MKLKVIQYDLTNKELEPLVKHLRNCGYEVEDKHLSSREETDEFKEKHDVKTTPQTFINDKCIGGYDDLKVFFGKDEAKGKVTYKPIINIFTLTFIMAVVMSYAVFGGFQALKVFELFMGFSVCMLAALKLKDVESFSTGFLNYDLLAKRWVKYAYIYPYAEAFAGIGMLSMTLLAPVAAPISFIIGLVHILYPFLKYWAVNKYHPILVINFNYL